MQNETMEECYNEWKAENFHSKKNQYVEKRTHILHKPLWTAAKLRAIVKDLTYRQINDWDRKNLIYSSRKTAVRGWRRLSIADMIRLCIVSDLRKIGVGTEEIRTILKRISTDSVRLTDTKTGIVKSFKFLGLEHAITSCVVGVKMLLLVAENERTFLLEEDRAVLFHFYVEDASSPIIILPFFSYVKQVFELLRRDEKLDTSRTSTLARIIEGIPTEKERKILDIIRKNAYQEIRLEKANGEVIDVKTTEKRVGKFTDKDIVNALEGGEYGSVKVVTKQGQKVQIIKEDRQRI